MEYKIYTKPVHISKWEHPDKIIVYTHPQDPIGSVLYDRYTSLTSISELALLKLLDAHVIRQATEDEEECLGVKDYKIIDTQTLVEFLNGRSGV